MFRRVRSTCRRTSYEHTEGTEISYIRHKNRKFLCLLCATCVPGVCAQCVHILGGATHLKIQHLSFPTPCPDCSNSSWLFLKLLLKFCQKLKSDEPALNDVFKERKNQQDLKNPLPLKMAATVMTLMRVKIILSKFSAALIMKNQPNDLSHSLVQMLRKN